jgi:hypothetical protein
MAALRTMSKRKRMTRVVSSIMLVYSLGIEGLFPLLTGAAAEEEFTVIG